MRELTALAEIAVPDPKPDEIYTATLLGRTVRFQGLKQLLGAADYSKAGDRQAGLAAPAEDVREAARSILSELSVAHLYERPLTDERGAIDRVMRVNYDIDRDAYAAIAPLTLGELKDRLLTADGGEIDAIGRALTGPMATALAKLCDVHELVGIAKKASRPRGPARCWARREPSRRACSRTIRPTIRPEFSCCVIGACLWAGGTR